MRRLMLAAALVALAVPAVAQKNDPVNPKDCYGEPFEINGKKVCFVITNSDDYYRVVDQKTERIPHLKLSGSLLVNSMMTEQFDQDLYNYTGHTGTYGWPRMDSQTSLERERLGWGLSAQWSADGVWWFEASWERPERVNIGIDTTRVSHEFYWQCTADSFCPARGVAYQTNRHSFTADDFMFGVLYDLSGTENDKHFSVLLGGGIHRRYITDRYSISTRSGTEYYRRGGFVDLAGVNDRNDTDTVGTTKTAQTRIFGQIDLELYPAGKDRFVGLVLSSRVLSDGAKEQNFPTSTLNDEDILLGIQPGTWDVTARLVLRF